jgi:DNA-binding LacI/PurR family transcriptional regulator
MSHDESGPVPLRMIADRAGVSVSSVSRVLAGRGDLRQETREKILRAARELHYDPRSGLRGRPTALDQRLIELVLGTFDDAWTAEVARGARQAAFRLGFDLVLTLERDDPADDWPARVAARKPSGVLVGIIRPTHTQLARLRGLRIPVVLLDPRSDPEGELASVGTTDWQGGYDAGAHLIQSGSRSFMVVTGVPAYRFGRARERGFRAAVGALAPESEILRIDSQWTDASPTPDMVRALRDAPVPIGVFATNDEMALAVYSAASIAGKRIPQDIRVVGFDDEPRAAAATPPLTSVRQPLREMAQRGVELLRELRDHEADHYERVELPTRLIVRDSTSSARS